MRKSTFTLCNFYFAFCIFLFALYLLPCGKAAAQDIHFSQYYASPLSMNPSLAGSANGNARVLLTYKDQWGKLENPYTTYSFSSDVGFFKNKKNTGFMGAGINLTHDVSGLSKLATTTAGLTASYHVNLNRLNILAAGIQGGIIQKKINAADMQWDSQFDGTGYNSAMASGENITSESFMLGDASIGLVWNYQSEKVKNVISNEGIKSELGVAAFHVNKPEYSFYNSSKDNLNSRFVVHGKASAPIPNTIFAVVPTFVYMKQGPSGELIFGSYIRIMLNDNSANRGFLYTAAVSVGAHYRNKDAAVLSVMFEKIHFAIGLSYDVNISSLKYASKKDGGLEITLRYTTPNPFDYRKKGNSLL